MTQHTRTRRLAILAAGAVASTSLMFIAAPAQAADTTPAAGAKFSWSFSDYLGSVFTGHEATGGAVVSGTGVVFGGGTGTGSVGAGTFDVKYQGSAAFEWHGVTLTFSSPEVVVAAGEGKVEADVAWAIPAQGPSPAINGSAADVVLTTFATAGATWNATSLAATPRWAGVLPPNTPASAAAGMAAGKPVNGEAWAPELLTALPASTRGYFFSSGANPDSDAKKAPAAFTAEAPVPTVAATPSYANQSVSIKADGTGFTGTDNNPGDDGVYVGLAPAGGLPATATQADMDKFIDAEWIPASALGTGSFSRTLSAAATALTKGTAYSVYTWRAHSHSSTSQDTETPVTIDWSKLTVAPAPPLKAATTLTAKVAKKPTTAKGGTLAVTLKAGGGKPAGKVTVKLTSKGKKAVTRTANAKNGKVSVKLPKLKAGTWKATVVYAGSDDFTSAKKVVSFKVKKSKKK